MAVTINRASDQFLLDSYSGGGGYLSGAYLVPHPRESVDKLAARKQLATYPNYVKKVVDIYSGFLWQRTPSREGSDLYAEFQANADGVGTGLDMLLQSYQRLAMLLGTVWVIVDKPAVQAETRAQEPMPYLVPRLPGQLVRSKTGPRGELTEAVFSEAVDGETRYRTFTATAWSVHTEADGSGVIAQGEHRLGRLPVVRLHSTIPVLSTDLRALPWAHDLAQLNWDLYNQCSELRELFRAQTFAILALPVQDEDDAQRIRDLTLGTENALSYNPIGGGKPEFIAPPPNPVQLYQQNIADTIVRIYQAANLEFISGVGRQQGSTSGVALAFHFAEANRTLGVMAALAEQAEREIAALVSAWQGQTFEGTIAYPRDFNLSDLNETLTQAMEAVQLQVSPTFDAQLKKRIARLVLGHGVAQATMDTIDGEIEAGDDPYGDRVAKEAGTR